MTLSKTALADKVNHLNWEEPEKFFEEMRNILQTLAENRSLLAALVLGVRENSELMSLCERYDFFDKIVLLKDPANRFRLRLSIFSQVESNRPHFHRWSYGCLLLRGSYMHAIFGKEQMLEGNVECDSLIPLHLYKVTAGSSYFLHHSLVHAVKAEEGTVSLLLQGPPMKERFLVVDRKIKKQWWEYCTEKETFEERKRKQMSKERLDALTHQLKIWSII